jgi:type IV pilus modification protein PilV
MSKLKSTRINKFKIIRVLFQKQKHFIYHQGVIPMLCDTSVKNLRLSEPQGFTLIEVMIAMVIFLIGFLAVGSMQISAVNSNASSRIRTEASVIAAQHAERILALPFADIDASVAGYPIVQGPYTINPPTIISRTDKTELTATNNRVVSITVEWDRRGRPGNVTYSLMAVNM